MAPREETRALRRCASTCPSRCSPRDRARRCVSALLGSATIVCECGIRSGKARCGERARPRAARSAARTSSVRRAAGAKSRERRRAGSSSCAAHLPSDAVGEGCELVRGRAPASTRRGRRPCGRAPPSRRSEYAGEQADGAAAILGRPRLRLADECERALECAARVSVLRARPSNDDGDLPRRRSPTPADGEHAAMTSSRSDERVPARCGRSRRASTYRARNGGRDAFEVAGGRPGCRSSEQRPRCALRVRRRRRGAARRRGPAAGAALFEPSSRGSRRRGRRRGASYVTIASRPRFVRVTRAAPSGVSGATSCATLQPARVERVAIGEHDDLRDDAVAELHRGRVERRVHRQRAHRLDAETGAARPSSRTAATAAATAIDADRGDPGQRAHRRCFRSSAQAMNARSIASGSLVPRTTGSSPSAASSASRRRCRSSFASRRLRASLRGQAHERDATAARIHDRHARRPRRAGSSAPTPGRG